MLYYKGVLYCSVAVLCMKKGFIVAREVSYKGGDISMNRSTCELKQSSTCTCMCSDSRFTGNHNNIYVQGCAVDDHRIGQ